MKKIFTFILALVMAAALAGCGSDVEVRLSGLEEQLALLQSRVTELEAENEVLRAALENAAGMEPATETEASAELYLTDWLAGDGELTLDIFARAMLPAGAQVSGARLLLLSGSTCQELPIELRPGEADGSFEAELSGLTFTIPELEPDDELELQLMVTFTGGSVIQAYGVSWYLEEGMLCLISG